jgi:hypothetical protein
MRIFETAQSWPEFHARPAEDGFGSSSIVYGLPKYSVSERFVLTLDSKSHMMLIATSFGWNIVVSRPR